MHRLLNIILLTLSTLILVLNLHPQPKTRFEVAKEKRDHRTLSEIFLANNDYINAKKESEFMGVELITEPEIVSNDIKKWEKLTLNNPNYRDGYIKLAVLNWRLFKTEETKHYLSLAAELDPNHPLPELP